MQHAKNGLLRKCDKLIEPYHLQNHKRIQIVRQWQKFKTSDTAQQHIDTFVLNKNRLKKIIATFFFPIYLS